MSTTDDIRKRVAQHHGKQLFYLPTLVRGDRPIRELIVSEEVRDCVAPPWAENWMGQRHSEFRGVLDSFTRGDWMAVCEKPFMKPDDTDVARVDPVTDEIWDIRCINPNARIRCFGAFGGKDFFIALTWQYREDLSCRDEWEDEINRCKSRWDQLFNPLGRFQGASLDEYLSNFTAV